jgi:signal transduction histidine kinase
LNSTLRDRRKLLIPFFWFGFALVFILNIFVWLYIDQVERAFRSELENKLSAAGRLITRLLDDTEISSIIPGEKTSIEYLYYRQLFEEIVTENNLQNIILFSPAKEILVSVPDISDAISSPSLIRNENFEKAVNGKFSASGIQEFSGEQFMTVFIPVLNIDGFVTAVVLLEAPANYFSVLSKLRNRVLLFSAINFVLLALFAFFLYKIMKRTIEYQTQIKDEEHLVQLGTMAATVAHELRNPLNIIEGTNDIIRKKYSDKKDEIFTFIPDEVERLSKLIDNFLHLARMPVLKPEERDIDTIISRLKLSISEKDAERVQFHKPDKPITFITDFDLLQQALLNLIINALQADKKGDSVQVFFDRTPKNHLMCKVEDTGSGIKPELQDRIFEPFFTTKESGTGLGLAITKRLVQNLGGDLTLESQPGKKTVFTISLRELKS